MAFEKGNKLGAKGKLFDQALKRAIAQDDGKRLREAAETLLSLAAQGEAWAVRELADRLDGRPAQESMVEVIDRRAAEVDDATLINIATGSGPRVIAPEISTQVTH